MRERIRKGERGFLFMLLAVLLLTAMSSRSAMAASGKTIPNDAAYYNGNGHYYYVYDVLSSSLKKSEAFAAAEEYCESLGGHLATITSAEEDAFVFQAVRDQGYTNAYFGFTDEAKEGTWVWVTGESVSYTNWASGEPNNDMNNEKYGMYYYKYSTGEWNDGNFNAGTQNGGKAFICEWDNISISTKKEVTCSHSYTSSVVEPTYFAQGYTLHTCSKCGDTYKDNYTLMKSLSISSLKNKSGYVQIKWSKVSGATGYDVYRQTNNSGSFTKIAKIGSGSTVSLKDKTVKNGKTYSYMVKPYKGSTIGAGSSKKIVYLSDRKISGLKNTKGGNLVVKWKKNSKATGYQIQWSKKKNFNSKSSAIVYGASTKSYTISGLKKGTKYYVRIRPFKTDYTNGPFYGAWSLIKGVKIKK